MSLLGRRTAARRNAGKRSFRLAMQLEALEDRALLSASPTWDVQSDYFGTRDVTSEPRSLRGLALTSDGANLYGGFIQGTSSAAIREVSSAVNADLIGNDGGSPTNSYGTNPAYTTGIENKVTTYDQAKGLDTDDRGYVYATLSNGTNSLTQQWTIYSSDLSAQVATETSTNFIAARTLSGIAAAKVNGHYYVYIGWQNGQIERWNVDNPAVPALDTSWGSAAHPGTISLKTINVNAYLDGLTVDTDGTIYVAGGLQGTTSYGDSLIKIPAAAAASGDLSSATHVDVQGGANGSGGFSAMDVALFGGQAYVTEYLADNSTIAVFNKSDLSSDGIITPTNPTGPSGLDATYSTGVDSGLSGIDISSDGKIYVVEQIYNYVASADSYTPPGGTAMTGTRIYFDRIMVSSALGVAPAITSAASTTFTTGVAGSFTVTSTGTPDPVLTETGTLPGGVTFVDNGDGTATLAGTPAAGTGGVYAISIMADNGVSPAATQAFSLTVNQAPAVTSSDSTSFIAGTAGTFTVTTSGYPTSTLTETGSLPGGVTFVDNGDGTATLAGTPAAGTGGVYAISIMADNGVSPAATQAFTLTVNQAPAITSGSSTTFAEGETGTFTFTTTGFPAPTLTESGALPSGVTFVDNGDGTATLAGTPTVGAGGLYSITVTAHNGIGSDATQTFHLTVTTKFGYLAGVPGDGTPETFVRNLYRELLGREPDAAGLAHWVSYAQANPGAATNASIVRAFMNSAEYKSHYVTTLYQVFLGRSPDAAGLQFWTEKMGQPGTPGMHSGSADEKYVLAAILGSDEYYNNAGGTPEDWVNAVYQDILGRAPDSSGAAYWANKLSAGTDNRDHIARTLLSQPEVAHDLLNSFYPDQGGTAAHPLAPAGSQAGAGLNKLALITGAGWENLFLNGPYDHQPEGNDVFFHELASGVAWDDVQYEILTSAQYYDNDNQPVT